MSLKAITAATLGDIIATELADLIESEGFDLSEVRPNDDILAELMVALDSESLGRVMALVNLVEALAARYPGPTGDAIRRTCLPGRLAARGYTAYTVVGVYEDTRDRAAEHVLARDAAHAESLVDYVVSGVFKGHLFAADAEEGRG